MSETQPTIHSVTDGGVSAEHGALPVLQALLAPTHSAGEHNTIREFVVPRACWMVEDARFDFDSSFVLPEIATEIRLLVALRQRLPDHPLSVFGHADLVGNDDYNKTLSGRRAIAIKWRCTAEMKRSAMAVKGEGSVTLRSGAGRFN
jgi:hypothetical protein